MGFRDTGSLPFYWIVCSIFRSLSGILDIQEN